MSLITLNSWPAELIQLGKRKLCKFSPICMEAVTPNNELVMLEYEEIKQQVLFERTEGAKSYLDLLKPWHASPRWSRYGSSDVVSTYRHECHDVCC